MKTDYQTDKVVDHIIENLDPNSQRKQLIDAAHAFKSNWVTFGEYLTQVASEKLYLQWGYRSFEEYCKIEIRIKKYTAIKLTNAYFFVTQDEPSIGENFEMRGVPELDVVSFLHKAKQDDHCTPEIFEDLKEAAFEKGQSGPTLARRYRQMTAPVGSEAKIQVLEQSLLLVKRLQQKIQTQSDIPETFYTYLSEMSDFFSNAGSADEPLEKRSYKDLEA